MKVLVTGGTGFIGGHVVDRLLEVGHEPVIFDRHVRAAPARCELILGDVRDATAVTEAVAHVEAVIHLAAVLGTQETIHNPRPAAETNVLGALNVFEAVAEYELPAAYAAVGNYWMENTYSISKTCAERFARMFNQERGTRIAIVRALNAYGPRQSVAAPFGPSKVRKVAPAFICRALLGEPIEVYGDGTQVMDMIHVRDVAETFIRALETGPHPEGIPYEAGTGVVTTVLDVAQAVARDVEAKISAPVEIVHLPMRPGEPERSIVLGDPGTLEPLFEGPPAFVALEDGISETVDWYSENVGITWGF
jgi:nucleoside-diphosphate-sugar epimerase